LSNNRGNGDGQSFRRDKAAGIERGSIVENQCIKCGSWKGAYGLEPTVDMYVEHTVEILRAIRRVLSPAGTVYWNLGDSYAGSGGAHANENTPGISNSFKRDGVPHYAKEGMTDHYTPANFGLKPKDLCLIPFRVSLAAQADGWWVRSVIIWNKPNPMPESCKDRPTESHEYILMLTKSRHYYFDMEAVREPQSGNSHDRGDAPGDKENYTPNGSRNIRSVWDITTQPFKDAHFATFPEEIPKRCILASTSEKGNCAKCGTPWVRVVKTAIPGSMQKIPSGWDIDAGAHGTIHRSNREDANTRSAYEKGTTANRLALLRQQARENGGEYTNETVTLGWKPSCKCGADVVKPVVLDPFGGSGTTNKVAKELGRKSIYIDTSEKYCEMARKRIMLVTLPMEIIE
jgi:DNA modification methylase